MSVVRSNEIAFTKKTKFIGAGFEKFLIMFDGSPLGYTYTVEEAKNCANDIAAHESKNLSGVNTKIEKSADELTLTIFTQTKGRIYNGSFIPTHSVTISVLPKADFTYD